MLESGSKMMHGGFMERWTTGYSQSELDDAQERYGLHFPPDLIDLLLDRQPVDGYNWKGEDHRVREKLAWPLDMLMFDVEHGSWWSDWGERPSAVEDRRTVVRNAVAAAPALIPLYSHRFIPETPRASGNPVFSMHGLDTIYYGSNLENYFAREFGDNRNVALGAIATHIPFWSDLAGDDETKWI